MICFVMFAFSDPIEEGTRWSPMWNFILLYFIHVRFKQIKHKHFVQMMNNGLQC